MVDRIGDRNAMINQLIEGGNQIDGNADQVQHDLLLVDDPLDE